ncbi:UNKNOWN [Stylonychia lemnae]|uniref:YHYH domain-containing protein n=1 Tax=Stylonychia lemnae TaxID=5949 RepID=A0A078AV57_STYLE|nr:UNKNOWN [Stylonychia lemnae]|eukprot:CDW86089.1 UNKNOWN [Stylonychia lemnae]
MFMLSKSDNHIPNYETITCAQRQRCPDSILRETCTWQRFLYFGCTRLSPPYYYGEISKYTILTNSLPDHCYFNYGELYPTYSQDLSAYGFSGIFNPNIFYSDMFEGDDTIPGVFDWLKDYSFEIWTQGELDAWMCNPDWARSAYMTKKINYEEFMSIDSLQTKDEWVQSLAKYPYLSLPTSNYVVGVALNGVFFFSGTSTFGYDAFFPRAYENNINPREILPDVCLGQASTYNTYRYHMFSPCIFDNSLKLTQANQQCFSHAGCKADKLTHSVSKLTYRQRNIIPIGLARDGRMIYGPYNQDGQLWNPCDVDICNGVYISRITYAYVATMFHPYIIGCWGPGNMLNLTQSCSTNPRQCIEKTGAIYNLSISLLTFIAATLAFLQ